MPRGEKISASSPISSSFQRSMPSEVIWNERQSANLSTVRPGRPSDSPNTTRQESAKPRLRRYSHARRRRRRKNSRSIVSSASRVSTRTQILESGFQKPRAAKRRRLSSTSTRPPFSQVSSAQSSSFSKIHGAPPRTRDSSPRRRHTWPDTFICILPCRPLSEGSPRGSSPRLPPASGRASRASGSVRPQCARWRPHG